MALRPRTACFQKEENDEIMHMFATSNVSMASTFYDDGKIRLYCGFEDNFESRITQM
jgi:hypothetical protein